jgi:hypothetical protein
VQGFPLLRGPDRVSYICGVEGGSGQDFLNLKS